MIDGRGGILGSTVYASPSCRNELIERFVTMRVSCEGERKVKFNMRKKLYSIISLNNGRCKNLTNLDFFELNERN